MSNNSEQKLANDAPLTAADIKNFESFYQDFLGKNFEDPMAFLKASVLLRRGDLRKYVYGAVIFQARYKQLIPEAKQRDLLLSFPSTIRSVYNLIFDFSESYGSIKGQTTVQMAQDQISDHLDKTEMFRLDVDKAMEVFPSVLPQDKQFLEEFLKSNGTEKEKTSFLLIILADHPFLSLIPKGGEQASTMAIGKVRSFLEAQLGAKSEDHLIEFFVVGGGDISSKGPTIFLSGENITFDPQFADINNLCTLDFKNRFTQRKFALVEQILKTEFSGQQVTYK